MAKQIGLNILYLKSLAEFVQVDGDQVLLGWGWF